MHTHAHTHAHTYPRTHTHTPTHPHTHIPTYPHTHTPTYPHSHTHTLTHTHIHTFTHTHTHSHIYTQTPISRFVSSVFCFYIYPFVGLFVQCVCISVHFSVSLYIYSCLCNFKYISFSVCRSILISPFFTPFYFCVIQLSIFLC
jgi:hypothetical protein